MTAATCQRWLAQMMGSAGMQAAIRCQAACTLQHVKCRCASICVFSGSVYITNLPNADSRLLKQPAGSKTTPLRLHPALLFKAPAIPTLSQVQWPATRRHPAGTVLPPNTHSSDSRNLKGMHSASAQRSGQRPHQQPYQRPRPDNANMPS